MVKTRFRPLQLELGLRLPDRSAGRRLEKVGKSFGSESSDLKVVAHQADQVDDEGEAWIGEAFGAVGGRAAGADWQWREDGNE